MFVDGPVHDHPAQAERDTGAEERLIDAGWTVIRVRHDDDWTVPWSLASSPSSARFGR